MLVVRVVRDELPVTTVSDSIRGDGEVEGVSGEREVVVSGSSWCLRN